MLKSIAVGFVVIVGGLLGFFIIGSIPNLFLAQERQIPWGVTPFLGFTIFSGLGALVLLSGLIGEEILRKRRRRNRP